MIRGRGRSVRPVTTVVIVVCADRSTSFSIIWICSNSVVVGGVCVSVVFFNCSAVVAFVVVIGVEVIV